MQAGAAIAIAFYKEIFLMQTVPTKCLDEIERIEWGEPDFESSLVVTCHKLRKKPLSDFTAEDLRIMIGQDISTEILVPEALNVLSEDPMISGDLYEGDLLAEVARLPEQYWLNHRDQYPAFQMVARLALERLNNDEEPDRELRAQIMMASTFLIEDVEQE